MLGPAWRASPGSAPPVDVRRPTEAQGACPTSQPPALAAGETRTVTIQTDKGAIAIKVKADLSPIAAGNFVALAGCGYYDGVVFHRVVPGFVIQGGDGRVRARHPTATQRRPAGPATRSGRAGHDAVQARHRGDGSDRRPELGRLAVLHRPRRQGPPPSRRRTRTRSSAAVTSGMDAVDAIAAAAGGQENPSNPVAMTKVTVSNP